MTLLSSVTQIIAEEMEKNGLVRLTRVTIKSGALAGLAPEAMRFAWGVLTDSGPLLLQGEAHRQGHPHPHGCALVQGRFKAPLAGGLHGLLLKHAGWLGGLHLHLAHAAFGVHKNPQQHLPGYAAPTRTHGVARLDAAQGHGHTVHRNAPLAAAASNACSRSAAAPAA